MKYAICTGSFDPPTLGHMDIFQRASMLFDRVYIAVLENPNKKYAFTPDERADMLNTALRSEGITNVFAEVYSGLAVDYARSKGACCMVRGIRDQRDFFYETGLEGANKYLAPDIETIYLSAWPELSFISSSTVKEIASYKRDIDGLVPEAIKNTILERLTNR